MKASLEWLGDFVDLAGFSPREIADKLTLAGLEVEDLRDRFAHLGRVVAARLERAEPLAGAGNEHLRLWDVSAGDAGCFRVVCGAPNARVGLVAPLALAGAVLPGDREVRAARIFGRTSEGMLCSAAELGLGSDAAGLMELEAEPGRTLKEITGRADWALEIGITPNRPDALSILGLARDLAALLDRPLTQPAVRIREEGPDIHTLAKVSIEDPEHCRRFAARVIVDVALGPSPDWLADRLTAVGLRPINNIVDITNYVMMELGQPLHAYDLEEVADRHLIARAYPKGTRFTTLDGQERLLAAEINLMICDGAKPVGLAGIMGGLNSEIKPSTRHILLEGAAFTAATIRRTSRANGLSTDASYRFERGSDPEICGLAVDRAAELMRDLAGGRVAVGRLDQYPRPFEPVTVEFSPARANAYLGTNHRPEDMVRVLAAIGLDLAERGDPLTVRPPSWRPDLSREVDVWEEVARLLDFDKIPATLPQPPARRQDPPPAWRLRELVREHLAALGLAESITYSFINPNFAAKLDLPEDSPWRKRALPLVNPLSEEQSLLRPLLAPSLLNALKVNQSYGRAFTALFEVGRVFLASSSPGRQPEERETIAGLLSGAVGRGHWLEPRRPVDFWDIKGLVESLNLALNLPAEFKRVPDPPSWYEPAEAAVVELPGGERLGHLGRLNKKAAQAFGLKEAAGPVHLFELDAELILARGFGRRPFVGWSKFPSADRDLAVVLPEDLPAAEVAAAIGEDKSLPLADILLFDLYQGDQLPAGRKSLAFRLTFQAPDRTLTDDEVSEFCGRVTTLLGRRFGAALRS